MNDSSSDENLTKVRFSLDPEDWHGYPDEGLWAEPVGKARPIRAFRLRNSPFFARGVSYLDVVHGTPCSDGLGFDFSHVIEHSGHSTYMALVPPACPEFDRYWERLGNLGCSYESKSHRTSLGDRVLYSIDVPAQSDVHAVYSILDEGERKGIWMFQEGHVGHKLKS